MNSYLDKVEKMMQIIKEHSDFNRKLPVHENHGIELALKRNADANEINAMTNSVNSINSIKYGK